jgi:hypothetical protein
MMIVDPEPTDEMIEAALIAIGFAPNLRAATMQLVKTTKGTAHEPGVCCEIRAVLAIINGVPLSEIKRGFRTK